MVLHKQNSIADYTRLLQANTAEVDALNQDILIGVTSFFRDPDAFDQLRDVIPLTKDSYWTTFEPDAVDLLLDRMTWEGQP